jgi:hypothetical protein
MSVAGSSAGGVPSGGLFCWGRITLLTAIPSTLAISSIVLADVLHFAAISDAAAPPCGHRDHSAFVLPVESTRSSLADHAAYVLREADDRVMPRVLNLLIAIATN